METAIELSLAQSSIFSILSSFFPWSWSFLMKVSLLSVCDFGLATWGCSFNLESVQDNEHRVGLLQYKYEAKKHLPSQPLLYLSVCSYPKYLGILEKRMGCLVVSDFCRIWECTCNWVLMDVVCEMLMNWKLMLALCLCYMASKGRAFIWADTGEEIRLESALGWVRALP